MFCSDVCDPGGLRCQARDNEAFYGANGTLFYHLKPLDFTIIAVQISEI
jgi:hypothetical protein